LKESGKYARITLGVLEEKESVSDARDTYL